MRILIAEDDQVLADGLLRSLRGAGYAVDHVATGSEADAALASHEFDLVILDLGLPRLHGLEVLRKLRARGSSMPVLILTAADSVEQRVKGLDLGADDYMVKPFELPELLARLRALLRRSQAATTAVLSFGPLEMDTANRRATVAGQTLDLGPREWTVMEYLLINAPKPASKEKLLHALTGWDKEITPNAVEVYVSRLRGKLEPFGLALRSIRGFGYRLEALGGPAGSAGPDDTGDAGGPGEPRSTS